MCIGTVAPDVGHLFLGMSGLAAVGTNETGTVKGGFQRPCDLEGQHTGWPPPKDDA